jgi:ribosome-associated protein
MNEEYDYEFEDGEVEYYAVRPNKTQIKREMAALFALGEEMSGLTASQLKTLELPENINKAVAEVAGMPLKGARKRLLKFIAAQLHKIDVEPIREKLARIKNKSVHAVREHHIVERWRDRLITEGDDALTELLDEHPGADRQQIRQLIRSAKKEAETAKPPKSSRMLYRYLKALFNVQDEEETIDDMPSQNPEI